MTDLLALARAGLLRLEVDGSEATASLLRAAPAATSLALDPLDADTMYLGTRGDGVWKSRDGGRHWADLELPASDVFSLAVSPADGSVYAGCEPSRLFRSRDGGTSWHDLEALVELPSAPSWSFPPRPWTSHVSAIAPHPRRAELLLVGIELGGLMRSEDGGASWQDHRPGAQRDVHALAWHTDGDRAYETGGGGAAWSRDGGQSWVPADEGRDRHYCWALAVDPSDADVWYLSASPDARRAHGGENAEAVIYRWRGGGPWEAMDEGLPRPLRSLPVTLAWGEERLYAGLRGGELYVYREEEARWRELRVSGRSMNGLRTMVGRPAR